MQDDSVDAVSDTDESMNVNSRTPSASQANHGLVFTIFRFLLSVNIYVCVCMC